MIRFTRLYSFSAVALRSRQRSVATALWIAVIALLASVARADTVYTYTGQNYYYANSPLNTSESVTGSFTVATPLADNLNLATITPESFSFNDGYTIENSANSTVSYFEISTDAAGNITGYQIETEQQRQDPMYGTVLDDIVLEGLPGYGDTVELNDGLDEARSASPGHFSAGVMVVPPATVTPEPSSLFLLATGLLTGAGTCLRRLRAA